MNKLIQYFDLASALRSNDQRAVGDAKKLPWLPQYVALVLGILVQPYFQSYMSHGKWQHSGFVGWLIASLVIGVMAFPAVYKESFDLGKPLFVQLCVIFTAGTGWQTIVKTALKGMGAE